MPRTVTPIDGDVRSPHHTSTGSLAAALESLAADLRAGGDRPIATTYLSVDFQVSDFASDGQEVRNNTVTFLAGLVAPGLRPHDDLTSFRIDMSEREPRADMATSVYAPYGEALGAARVETPQWRNAVTGVAA